jgi:hypothetical protein
VIATGAGTRRYQKFCRRLGRGEMPSPHAEITPLLLGWSLMVLGIVMVVVLLA